MLLLCLSPMPRMKVVTQYPAQDRVNKPMARSYLHTELQCQIWAMIYDFQTNTIVKESAHTTYSFFISLPCSCLWATCVVLSCCTLVPPSGHIYTIWMMLWELRTTLISPTRSPRDMQLYGNILRSRPWFCQMFSMILMIWSVSMFCRRSETNKVIFSVPWQNLNIFYPFNQTDPVQHYKVKLFFRTQNEYETWLGLNISIF